jgi:Mor family transcriptional regulator
MNNVEQRIKSQGALLKETLDTLREIQTTLFDIRQGELFDDEGMESINNKDDIECKNEVFGELRDLLGNEQAEKVADYFSGSLVYFSKNVVVARKYREIRKAFRGGATYRDLSTKYGYTETHIRNIVHKGGKNT